MKGKMSTVIGIFEDQYKHNKPLTVVKPEINLEDLHIDDTIEICFKAWKNNKCRFIASPTKKVLLFCKWRKCLQKN